MKRIILLSLLALAGMAAQAAGGEAVQASNAPIKQQMQVSATGAKVLVKMSFDNQSTHTVHLPRTVAEDGELFGKHFALVVAGTGQEVPYIGPMAKRAPFGPDDYLALKPHSKHSSTIDISRAFAFLPGTHAYRLSYAGGYVADLKQVNAVTPAPVTVATFSLTWE